MKEGLEVGEGLAGFTEVPLPDEEPPPPFDDEPPPPPFGDEEPPPPFGDDPPGPFGDGPLPPPPPPVDDVPFDDEPPPPPFGDEPTPVPDGPAGVDEVVELDPQMIAEKSPANDTIRVSIATYRGSGQVYLLAISVALQLDFTHVSTPARTGTFEQIQEGSVRTVQAVLRAGIAQFCCEMVNIDGSDVRESAMGVLPHTAGD